jgi:hypothetical protein
MRSTIARCGLLVSLTLGLLVVACREQLPEEDPGAKVQELMSSLFPFALTNGWQQVKASGGTSTPLLGRKRTEYFVLEHSGEGALDEMLEKFRAREWRHGVDGFHYVEEGDAKDWRGSQEQLGIAPWWRPETNGIGSFVQVSTNISGVKWVAFLLGFRCGTNSVLYVHLLTAD